MDGNSEQVWEAGRVRGIPEMVFMIAVTLARLICSLRRLGIRCGDVAVAVAVAEVVDVIVREWGRVAVLKGNDLHE